jgi:hypothetical protein
MRRRGMGENVLDWVVAFDGPAIMVSVLATAMMGKKERKSFNKESAARTNKYSGITRDRVLWRHERDSEDS